MVCGGLWWCVMVCHGLRWFVMVCVMVCDGLRWFVADVNPSLLVRSGSGSGPGSSIWPGPRSKSEIRDRLRKRAETMSNICKCARQRVETVGNICKCARQRAETVGILWEYCGNTVDSAKPRPTLNPSPSKFRDPTKQMFKTFKTFKTFMWKTFKTFKTFTSLIEKRSKRSKNVHALVHVKLSGPTPAKS